MVEMAIAAAAILTIAAAFLFGRKTGREKEQRDVSDEVIKRLLEAARIEADISRLSDDDVAKRLRERWTR